jgi:hypothetical protein
LELREQVAKEEKRSLSAKSKNRVKNRFLSLKNKIYNVNKSIAAKLFAKKIYKKTQLWANNPIATQKKVLQKLIKEAKQTQFESTIILTK